MAFGLATGLGVASTALSVYGQIQANQANAASLESEARYALYSARIEEKKMRDQGKQFIGAQAVAYAGSGISLDSSVAQRVMEQTQYEIELDAETIREGARLRAQSLRSQAKSISDSSKYAIAGGLLSAGGTILGGK